MTAPLSGITGSVLETRFTAVETGAFFGFARTAILTLGAVVVVPGHAAEEMILRSKIPSNRISTSGKGE